MTGTTIGPIGRAWLKWKSLRLPWRKRFLVGFDLQGNTYWEFRLTTRGTGDAAPNGLGEVERWRRIVQYPRATHLSAVKVGPLWHQWLRYTRRDPPSLEEQRGDVVRQARTKVLAADADARWAAKPRVMDAPPPPPPTLPETTTTPHAETTPLRAESRRRRSSKRPEEMTQARADDDAEDDGKDPWKKARTRGPSEDWQPQAWSPNAKK
ncbi:NADH:ubiquinone subunit [Cordyceps militaris]|uniref:NADH:ubiquinone subunit n=1 Tax=Cordyceps militaris TaxID=73501 RepID=A0A2H4SS61_CORMI|nr:NADH:ubiquinone subunit [Cordyceps militaris]